MKAAVIHRFGTADVLQVVTDHPVPQIDKNQVLIKVKAASVNPLDCKTRQGMLRPILGSDFPIILGNDAAGVVEQCGSQVKDFKVGDRVYGMLDANIRPSYSGFAKSGTYAEYAVTREDTLALIPEALSWEEAAVIPLCGLTAYQALVHKAKIKMGDRVLIIGASGGVGIYALQIAKALGGEVTAVCSRKGLGVVQGLGADHVIDYTQTDMTQWPGKYNVIYDIAATTSYSKIRKILTPRGIYVNNIAPMIVFLLPFLRKIRISKKHTFAWVEPSEKDLQKITELVNKGLLKPVIAKTFALDDIRAAHELNESGRPVGKIAVKIDG